MFEPDRLKAIGGQDNREFGGDIYTYNPSIASGDTIPSILSANFFLPAEDKLNVDDLIELLHPTDGDLDLIVAVSIKTSVIVRPKENEPFDTINGTAQVISVNKPVTRWTIQNAGDTGSLANGYEGQRKRVFIISASGGVDTGILTPASPLGYVNITLNNQGSNVDLFFTSGQWLIVGSNDITVA